MATFRVPSGSSSSSTMIGAYPKSPSPKKRSPRRPARQSPPPSPLPRRPTRGERILKSAAKANPTRWLSAKNGETVAVKRVPPTSKCDLRTIRSLRRRLNFPGIVRLVDYSGFGKREEQDPNNRHTCWEYCDQGTLADLLYENQKGVKEDLVWHVLVSLLKTALFIHTGERYKDTRHALPLPQKFQPIVHNDITPDNIFLQSPNNPTHAPIIKLGNFQKVVMLPSRTYETNDYDFPRHSTTSDDLTGFEAPEVTFNYFLTQPDDPDWMPFDEEHLKPRGTRSDLWSIAVVAVTMMGGVDRLVHPKFGTGASKKLSRWKWLQVKTIVKESWDESELPWRYSSQLRRFLASILVVDPRGRMETRECLEDCIEWYREWLGEREEYEEEEEDEGQ